MCLDPKYKLLAEVCKHREQQMLCSCLATFQQWSTCLCPITACWMSPLPELQHAGVLSARTTHFQRTIATLQGVLTGLYPNAAEAGIAIPAVTAGDGNEIMYGNANACAKLGQLNSSRLKMLKGGPAWLCSSVLTYGMSYSDEEDAY